MSAGQDNGYRVRSSSPVLAHIGYSFKVVRLSGEDGVIDAFRTRSGAEYAAELLNSGLASVDHHAIVGCKVVAS